MMSAIALVGLLGFTALGIEVGRWYAIQGEMSKSIDGAAFAGAKNINNPNIINTVGLDTFVTQVAQANFPAGILGSNGGAFTVTNDGNGKITVNGSAYSINPVAKAYDANLSQTLVAASGSAKLRNAEIALVLDISGSMSGDIGELKNGAKQFVQNFSDHQATSKFALLTFANGVIKNFDMNYNFVSPIESAINGLNALGGTNTEDALAQALALPWIDQSTLPPNERGKQVVVLFSDGNPTAFRGDFQRNGTWYDAAVPDGSVMLSYPNQQYTQISSYDAYPSGNGTGNSGTNSSNQCGSGSSWERIRWAIFTDADYGLNSGVYPPFNGYSSTYCFTQSQLRPYVTAVAVQMAIDNAQLIKNQGIEIYTIGLGDVDPNLLQTLSSGPEFAYYTTNSSELSGIFQQIANILKLVLVS